MTRDRRDGGADNGDKQGNSKSSAAGRNSLQSAPPSGLHIPLFTALLPSNDEGNPKETRDVRGEGRILVTRNSEGRDKGTSVTSISAPPTVPLVPFSTRHSRSEGTDRRKGP